jgi:hypothetical protein
MTSRRTRTAGRVVLAALVLGAVQSAGCGDGGESAPASGPATTATPVTAAGTTPSAATPDPGLPPETAGYRGWDRLNAEPIPQDAGVPHGRVKDVFVDPGLSEVADGAALVSPLPEGTIIVKRGSRGDDPAGVVAIMVKAKDSDPQHGDWTFTEFARSGTAEPYSLLAEGSACWSCHQGASDTDWVFTRPTAAR